MFPTCFDDALEYLSGVEKHLHESYSVHRDRNISRYQAELRFLKMFLWCFPDCDANLLADMNLVATSISEIYKIERKDAEYSSLASELTEQLRKCHAEINNKYRQDLILCSLQAEPFTSDETIGFIDSVHVNLNDLLNYYAEEFQPIILWVETLEETVFLIRNLVYYTPMIGENYDISFLSLTDFDANPQTDLIFQFNVHDWANKAACFSLLFWLIQREDEEIRCLYTDLQQKVGACNPEFIKLCFQNIKVPKMKREDRILFGEFVSRLD